MIADFYLIFTTVSITQTSEIYESNEDTYHIALKKYIPKSSLSLHIGQVFWVRVIGKSNSPIHIKMCL